MSCGKTLTNVGKGKNLAFLEENSQIKNARRLNRSEHFIRNFLKNFSEHGKNVLKLKETLCLRETLNCKIGTKLN